MKKYLIGGKVYSFEILETCELVGEHTNKICYYSKCLNNGKYAWLDDENGIQFVKQHRFIAEPYTDTCAEHYNENGFGAYTLWGGEFRPKYNWQKSPVSTRW